MIVMSDGAPADTYKGNPHEALLAAARQIQDEGKVELFGLGLKSDAVAQYYDNYEVINHSDEINNALLTVLARSVQYG